MSSVNYLKLRSGQLLAEIGYEIVLKENRGYNVDALYNKLKHVKFLNDTLDCIPTCEKKVKNNIIRFCGKKVFLSKKNSLFLSTDSDRCKDDLVLEEQCCIDICEVESQLNSIKNC